MKKLHILFSLQDISKYRSELMMLHFRFIHIKPLGFLAQYGFAGVDIFMLVSGFGLYYSLEKTTNSYHILREDFSEYSPPTIL